MKTTDTAPFLETRLARRVRVRLDEGLEALPHDVRERLRVARAQAVAGAPLPTRQSQGAKRRAQDDGSPSWPWRLASALPAVLLVSGLWGIGEWVDWERMGAVADLELALLNDELPVDAYADPGFVEFLRHQDIASPDDTPHDTPLMPPNPDRSATGSRSGEGA